MAYCTQADILNQMPAAELIRLTDDAATTVDADKVTAAIADAEAKVDSYAGARHAVPLNPVSASVKAATVDIAIYNLYGLRNRVPDDVRQRYEDALAWLRDVSTAKASLGVSDPDTTPTPTHRPQISSNPRIFTRDKMEGF